MKRTGPVFFTGRAVVAGSTLVLAVTLSVVFASSLSTAARSAASRSTQPAVVQAAPVASDHHCADLLAETIVQLAVVHGVWNCLEPSVKAMFKGTGDRALVGVSPYFTGARFIGCDGSMCVYALTFDATTAGTTGMSETTMTVWLDGRGLVAHAAIPKAIP